MAGQTEDRAAAIDRLYALPLDEFTAARDELSRRLRNEGDGDAAAEVKRLRKPSVAAWALNQTRRKNPGQSERLLEAGRRLREGQERLLAGTGREPLQRAAADERRLVGELARHAERELAAAGRPVGAAVRERLRATLHAAASDPEARELLAAGRLVHDHEASGLGPLGETGPARTGADRPQSAGATAAHQRKAARLEERLERARARRRELEEKSAEAGRRLREVRREAARAAAALDRAGAAEERVRERAEEAAEAVSELERELADLVRTGRT
jgi:hypothetical protein